jgi:hypothetical protein
MLALMGSIPGAGPFREPKESILSQFDVEVIGRYFPEFEREIGTR